MLLLDGLKENNMIRLVIGFALTFGSVGGMELSTLSPLAAFFLGVLGLLFEIGPIKDGTRYRLIDKI